MISDLFCWKLAKSCWSCHLDLPVQHVKPWNRVTVGNPKEKKPFSKPSQTRNEERTWTDWKYFCVSRREKKKVTFRNCSEEVRQKLATDIRVGRWPHRAEHQVAVRYRQGWPDATPHGWPPPLFMTHTPHTHTCWHPGVSNTGERGIGVSTRARFGWPVQFFFLRDLVKHLGIRREDQTVCIFPLCTCASMTRHWSRLQSRLAKCETSWWRASYTGAIRVLTTNQTISDNSRTWCNLGLGKIPSYAQICVAMSEGETPVCKWKISEQFRRITLVLIFEVQNKARVWLACWRFWYARASCCWEEQVCEFSFFRHRKGICCWWWTQTHQAVRAPLSGTGCTGFWQTSRFALLGIQNHWKMLKMACALLSVSGQEYVSCLTVTGYRQVTTVAPVKQMSVSFTILSSSQKWWFVFCVKMKQLHMIF